MEKKEKIQMKNIIIDLHLLHSKEKVKARIKKILAKISDNYSNKMQCKTKKIKNLCNKS